MNFFNSVFFIIIINFSLYNFSWLEYMYNIVYIFGNCSQSKA